MVKNSETRRYRKRSKSDRPRPPTLTNYPPYPGYGKNPEDMTKHERACERIHRGRRQVALHAFMYYQCDTTVVSDYQYELFVKTLLLTQLMYPDASNEVPFMKDAFLDNEFESTGFHVAKAVDEAEEGVDEAYSVKLAFHRSRANTNYDHSREVQDPQLMLKFKAINSKLAKVKKSLGIS